MHKLFPSSTFFDFETVRILGTTVYGGAETAEVLEAVGEIKANDPISWEKAWAKQAARAEVLAKEACAHGDKDAARRAYLRAANYTRASGYMFVSSPPANGDTAMIQHPCALSVSERMGGLFRKAIDLMDCPVQLLSIPYEGHQLPGYLYLPPESCRIPGRKIPILVNFGGADSCQEELFFMYPSSGYRQGYAVLTFDGPGQGVMLRRHGVVMRPNWEIVSERVIDHLIDFSAKNPNLELDVDSIAVAGASMGGYYALRAAADPRVKACVAIDPFFDMWDFGTAHVSRLFLSAWMNGWMSREVIDTLMNTLKTFSFQLKWEISVAGTFFGLSSPSDILLHMKKFSLAGSQQKDGVDYLTRVVCPVLVSGSGNSLYLDVDEHTKRCYDGLVNVPLENKEMWVPASPGQGSLQAKMGAVALCGQRSLQFLDRALGIDRPPVFL
ncbi:alpha beta hydrolase [Colletotrichum kahawae]|uniref:Alpha beta hydrolase n=1 Tax=Colletotrichum kahawae TaxID=34407 RepID=A0AAD9YJ37_COLKA|nr:alpha beta hydrolase [Colletotrichum kahawae]